MAQSNDTLFSIRGRVREFRKGISESQVDAFINDRIKQAADYREYWSNNIAKGIISIPAAYTTGTVSVTTGSAIVTGAGCNFPVNDAASFTVADGIVELGGQDVYPDSMAGVAYDSILYVDAAGPNPEAVPVNEILNQYGFNGEFRYLHAQGCTMTASSLAGRQFRIGGDTPIFTVLAVIDANTLLLDQPWGGAPLTAQAYSIYRMYFNLGPNVQAVFWVLDQAQGLPLTLHTSVRAANAQDPQRLTSGNPISLVDAHPSPGGIIQFEIWPPQIIQYQLQYGVYTYWKKLVNDTDRPPWFVNSTLWFYGALANALRYKSGEKDPYHNPALAATYEQMFMDGLQLASNADDAKVLRELSTMSRLGLNYPGGANFDQNHDFDMFYGNF